jgi:Vitamin K-dependent gamma-carboxylase
MCLGMHPESSRLASVPPVPDRPTSPAVRAPRTDRFAPAMTTFLEFARARWLTIDKRTLGLFRIAFGIALIGNLYDHTAGGNLVTFFTNDGLLPNHFALFAPVQPRVWSLLFAFSRPAEVAVAFLGILAVYVLYTVGYKTRWMQFLVWVCLVSLANRNLLLQDGGCFVGTIVAVWTMFLPVGARFSVDRWLADRRRKERDALGPRADGASHVSIVALVLFVQLAVIYGFNAANKTGETWRNGSAVHYILWMNGTNTHFAEFVRHHEPAWFSPLLTRGTLLFEWSAVLLALTPVFRKWARRVLIAGMWAFHLGIASMLSLGPFAYVMIAYSFLLVGPWDWEFLARRFPRLRPFIAEEGPEPAPERPTALRRAALYLREAVPVFLCVVMASEVTLVNPACPRRFRWESRPAWMSDLLSYMRIYQTWGMFSADPPLSDGRIVVDASLADGTHVDPLTDAPPDFEAPLGRPFFMGHDWSEYMLYFPWDRHRAYRDQFRDYVGRLDRLKGWPAEKKIRSVEVYWVSAKSPPPGGTVPTDLKREHLLSYVASGK